MKRFGELLAWAAFAIVVGVLSVWPRYEVVDRGVAILTLTFTHAAQLIGECRTLTQEDLDKLPPNMRKPIDCPRERNPVHIELRSSGSVIFEDLLMPSGIWSDGKANIYKRIAVPAGTHELFVGMNDSGGTSGFDFETSARVDLPPGRNLVIRFDELSQGFLIH
ncbi:MAG: hypothetical protein HKN64_02815 [Woeseiaceae bacterium]|nr:hypothetical protein [Woeseiaceae bacterium]